MKGDAGGGWQDVGCDLEERGSNFFCCIC